MKEEKPNEIISFLKTNKDRFLDHLRVVIEQHQFNYRTFGTEIEDYILDEIILALTDAKLIKSPEDYLRASNKNHFPELELYTNPTLAIEVKSGNHSKMKGNVWLSCNNSNNDMGTLNSWQSKIDQFGGENIYYIFIEYDFNDTGKKILDIKIEPFYKFIGLNGAGLLKYREKDGNLRPKDFSAPSHFSSFDEFNKLLQNTADYRAKRIIKKHYKTLSQEDKEEILAELKEI